MTSDCLNYIEAIRFFSPRFALFYETAYAIGCRFEELTDITRFQVSNINEVTFQPGKGNNIRKLTMDSLPRPFVQMIKAQESYFKNVDYQTNSRYFHEYWPNYPVLHYASTKRIRFYLFRYRFIRQLSSDGLDILDIAKIIGEKDPANIRGYLENELVIITPDN